MTTPGGVWYKVTVVTAELAQKTQVYIGTDAHRAAKVAAAIEGKTLREWLDAVILEAAKKRTK